MANEELPLLGTVGKLEEQRQGTQGLSNRIPDNKNTSEPIEATPSKPVNALGKGLGTEDLSPAEEAKAAAKQALIALGKSPEEAEAESGYWVNRYNTSTPAEIGSRIASNFGAPAAGPKPLTTADLIAMSQSGVEMGGSSQTGRTQAYQEDTRPEALKNQRFAEQQNVLTQQTQLDKQALDAAQKFQQEQADNRFYQKWAEEQEAKAKVELLKKQQAEAEAESKSAASAEVDPRRLFKQKGTFGSILLALSSATEAFGRALQGNFGPTRVQQMIDSDIRQQELEIARKGKKADNRLAQLTSELDNKERAVEQLKIEQLTALFDKQKAAFDKETNPLKKKQMDINLVNASNELNKALDASKYPIVTNQITKNTASAIKYGSDAVKVGNKIIQQKIQDGYQTTVQPALQKAPTADGYVTTGTLDQIGKDVTAGLAGTDGYQAEKPVIAVAVMPKTQARTTADTILLDTANKANEDKKQFETNIQRIDDEVKAGRLTPEQAEQAKRDMQANLDRIERDRAEAERIINLPTKERRQYEEDKVNTKYANIGLQLAQEAADDDAAVLAGKMDPKEKAKRDLARNKLYKENQQAQDKEILQVKADFAEPKVQPKPVVGKVVSKPVSEAKPDYQKQLDDLNFALINGKISEAEYSEQHKKILDAIKASKPAQKTGGESWAKNGSQKLSLIKRSDKELREEAENERKRNDELRKSVSDERKKEIPNTLETLRDLNYALNLNNIKVSKDGKIIAANGIPGSTAGEKLSEIASGRFYSFTNEASQQLRSAIDALVTKQAKDLFGVLTVKELDLGRELARANDPRGMLNYLINMQQKLERKKQEYKQDPAARLYVQDWYGAFKK